MIHLELSHRNKRQRGFTLIETLIYAAITTAILTFAILAVYQFIDGARRSKNLKELAENQRFLEQKIKWTLQSVSAINSPASGATTTSLSVNKLNFSNNPVVIDVNASNTARLKQGSASPQPITNNYVGVQDLTFHQFNFSGNPAIKITATLFNSYTSTTAKINTTIFTQ